MYTPTTKDSGPVFWEYQSKSQEYSKENARNDLTLYLNTYTKI